MFDTKIAVLLRDDLAGWQALNVTAFLVSGLPEELRGEPYLDADDVTYLPMFGQPVVVLQGDKDLVKKAHDAAEHGRNAVRLARREGNDKLKTQLKDKKIGEDDERRGLEEVQKLHDHYIADINKALEHKEKDILTV